MRKLKVMVCTYCLGDLRSRPSSVMQSPPELPHESPHVGWNRIWWGVGQGGKSSSCLTGARAYNMSYGKGFYWAILVACHYFLSVLPLE